jgi:ATP/maltotriose-dependent transcriptional regulator MalT/DNA-binding SARP family transcriptional activator
MSTFARKVLPAKLAAPRPVRVINRPRLFARLDEPPGRFWISGPGGSGKTSLAASWLASRKLRSVWFQLDEGDADRSTFFHYLALAAGHAAPRRMAELAALARVARVSESVQFTRNFARKLFAVLPPRSALVFDHVESVLEHSTLLEILVVIAREAPPAVPVLLLGRNEPPEALATLLSREDLAVIGWPELRMTREEAAEIAGSRNGAIDSTQLARLYDAADGWAAGLVLMLEWRQRAGADMPARIERGTGLFDYFARELLEARVPGAERQFLIAVACLPYMTARAAEHVTSEPRAAEILETLARNGLFTFRLSRPETRYRFHPLLRAFLLEQQRSLAPCARREAQLRAAEALEAGGDAAAAAEMLQALDEWPRLDALLHSHGDGLLERGQHRAIYGWLARLPAAVEREYPCLLYWRARAQVEIDPHRAFVALEDVWRAFEHGTDRDTLYRIWCAVVDCVYYLRNFDALGDWTPRFRALHARLPAPADDRLRRRVIVTTYAALAAWTAGSNDLDYWESAALHLLRDGELSDDTRLLLGSALRYRSAWFGGDAGLTEADVARLRRLAASPHVSPLARLRWRWIDGVNARFFDEDEDMTYSAACVAAAAAIGEELGLTDAYSQLATAPVGLCVFRGDLAAAERACARLLRYQPRSRHDAFVRLHVITLFMLNAGRPAEALRWARETQTVIERPSAMTGGLMMARVLAANRLRGEALAVLGRVRSLARGSHAPAVDCWAKLIAALIALDDDRRGRAALLARGGLERMARLRYVRSFYLTRADMSRLLSVAWEFRVLPEYVRYLTRIRRLPAPKGAGREQWPWPLEIRALGGFEVVRDGAPVEYSRKTPRKPLQLLKFLVASGSRAVQESAVMDALWGDEEPGAAYRAFIAALHRLRKLVGERTILFEGGTLRVDLERAWVDAFAFEAGSARLPAAEDALRRIIGLYRGPLLPGEHVECWTVEARERLRRRFVGANVALARVASSLRGPEAALAVYEQALDVEDAAEELFQGAIRCQIALGLPGEAVALYRRCEHALRTAYGVAPSPETRRLLQSVLRAGSESVTDR